MVEIIKLFQFRIVDTISFQWIILSLVFFDDFNWKMLGNFIHIFHSIWYFSSGVLARRLQTTSEIHFKVLMNTDKWSIGLVDKFLVYMGLYWLLYHNWLFTPWNKKLYTTPIFDSSRHGERSYWLQLYFTYRSEIWKCNELINYKKKILFKNEVMVF